MANNNQMVERRRYKRFKVQEGASVVFRAHSIELGQIIDVSRNGLAFRYVSSQQPSSGLFELVILSSDGGFYLDEIPFKIVSDFETNDDPISFSITRRCGVQFEKLRRKQVSRLEYFIQNHTIVEIQVNLASGKPSENRIHRGVATAHQEPLPPIPPPTGTISKFP